jgi:hypothetical protein
MINTQKWTTRASDVSTSCRTRTSVTVKVPAADALATAQKLAAEKLSSK